MRARINLASVFVDDQERALEFYTERLGFIKKRDQPVGEYRWLTVVGADDPDGVELMLEPKQNPAAEAFTSALVADERAAMTFEVDDVEAAHRELEAKGVEFIQAPAPMGPVTTAKFYDTVGNLILLTSPV